jgi:hypothetical protein
MRTLAFQALTNDSFYWRAVGIPLDIVDSSIKGDIDLLFAMRVYNAGATPRFSRIYRCFELKTSKVARDGTVKSLKEGKITKTLGQCQKLCRIGAPQVFLLEAFIAEAGYSQMSNGRMPDPVRESVAKKYDRMTSTNYGYVTMALEQIEGYSEEDTGVLWPAATIKEASTSAIGQSFQEIISAIETYISHIGGAGYSTVITYCNGCRELTSVHAQGPYMCHKCGQPLI